MRINPIFIPIIFIGVLLGTVFAAQQFGMWSTSGRTSVDLDRFESGEIKGWMTLQQISDGIGVPLDEVYRRVSIPASVPADTAVKDLEGMLEGFETSALREAFSVDAQSPAPEPTVMPTVVPTKQPAIAATVKVTGTHMVDGVRATPTPLPAGQVLPVAEIKGRMTLREVSEACAVPLDALLIGLELPESKADTAIKDLIAAGDLSDVTPVRDAASKLQSQ